MVTFNRPLSDEWGTRCRLVVDSTKWLENKTGEQMLTQLAVTSNFSFSCHVTSSRNMGEREGAEKWFLTMFSIDTENVSLVSAEGRTNNDERIFSTVVDYFWAPTMLLMHAALHTFLCVESTTERKMFPCATTTDHQASFSLRWQPLQTCKYFQARYLFNGRK